MRSRVLAVLALLVVSSCGGGLRSAGPCFERVHASGIALVCAEDIGPWGTAAEEIKSASSFAWTLAEANPDVFGYPTMDFAKGELVLRIVRPEGEGIARAWIASGAEIPTWKETRILPRPLVPVRLESATRSFAQLAQIQHDIGPNLAHLPDSNAIYQSAPDNRRNATRYVIDRESDALLRALSARYGTEALVVEVNPARPTWTY
jgi:hypothetical protein